MLYIKNMLFVKKPLNYIFINILFILKIFIKKFWDNSILQSFTALNGNPTILLF